MLEPERSSAKTSSDILNKTASEAQKEIDANPEMYPSKLGLPTRNIISQIRENCLHLAAGCNVGSTEIVTLAREFEDYITGHGDDRATEGGE